MIIQMSKGQMKNNRANRNFATWRLQQVEKHIKDEELKEFRNKCNCLWSHVYKLEHEKVDKHPYINKLRKSLNLK